MLADVYRQNLTDSITPTFRSVIPANLDLPPALEKSLRETKEQYRLADLQNWVALITDQGLDARQVGSDRIHWVIVPVRDGQYQWVHFQFAFPLFTIAVNKFIDVVMELKRGVYYELQLRVDPDFEGEVSSVITRPLSV